VAEIVALFGGIYFYLRGTKPITSGGRYSMVVFAVAMLAVHVSLFFGPTSPSEQFAASAGLVCYFIFAAVAYWLDKKRVSVAASRAREVAGVRNADSGRLEKLLTGNC
jgi:hypothetical protein